MTAKLPPEFSDLEPFSDWCLPTEPQRYHKRLSSSMAEMQAFYDAITPARKTHSPTVTSSVSTTCPRTS